MRDTALEADRGFLWNRAFAFGEAKELTKEQVSRIVEQYLDQPGVITEAAVKKFEAVCELLPPWELPNLAVKPTKDRTLAEESLDDIAKWYKTAQERLGELKAKGHGLSRWAANVEENIANDTVRMIVVLYRAYERQRRKIAKREASLVRWRSKLTVELGRRTGDTPMFPIGSIAIEMLHNCVENVIDKMRGMRVVKDESRNIHITPKSQIRESALDFLRTRNYPAMFHREGANGLASRRADQPGTSGTLPEKPAPGSS